MASGGVRVIKLGGSLLDLPDLAARLAMLRRAEIAGPAVLIVGGAEAADVVRRFDAMHHLDEGAAHWLAIRAMQFNTHLISAVLPASAMVGCVEELERAWQKRQLAILDPLHWLQDEVARGITIPHRWTFTSDSIAAHLATQLNADRLTLLKSTMLTGGNDIDAMRQAVSEGVVDADFEMAASAVKAVEIINLRHESLAQGFVGASARQWLRCAPR